jgi:hypothetical protein
MKQLKVQKLFLAAFLAFTFIFSSCRVSQSDVFQSNGTITGPDYRMCACCGGYYIVIDTATYDFDSLPKDANFSLKNATYPIYVKLDWKKNPTGCGNYIDIIRIEKTK